MLRGHLFKETLAAGSQPDPKRPAVPRIDDARHQALLLEQIRDAGDIAAGDHQPLRQLAHLETLGASLELRHEIETGQRGREFGLQTLPNMVLDQRRATEQPQPQPQRVMMILPHASLTVGQGRLGRLGAAYRAGRHHITSPPATAMLCPVMLALLRRHSQRTVSATSSGVTSRRWGLCDTNSASACASPRPVFAVILATAVRTRSVSVYPGHTALTVMFRRAVSSATARVSPITPCFDAQYALTYG